MFYYVFEGGKPVRKTVESCSESDKIEQIYKSACERFEIEYIRTDWADDDTDWGMGYEYDHSYTEKRAPKREELLLKDGKLYGFVVDAEYQFRLPAPKSKSKSGSDAVQEDDMKYTYIEINGKKSAKVDNSTRRYGDAKEWILKKR